MSDSLRSRSKYWRLAEQGRKLKAQVINYAKGFVILSRGCAAKARAWAAEVMRGRKPGLLGRMAGRL
jgi:hypothetical protein